MGKLSKRGKSRRAGAGWLDGGRKDGKDGEELRLATMSRLGTTTREKKSSPSWRTRMVVEDADGHSISAHSGVPSYPYSAAAPSLAGADLEDAQVLLVILMYSMLS